MRGALRAVAPLGVARERAARAVVEEEEWEGVVRGVHLRVVAGLLQLARALADARGDVGGAARGLGVERRGEALEARVRRVEQDEAVVAGERREQAREGFAEGAARPVALAHEPREVGDELARRQQRQQARGRLLHRLVEEDAADGLALGVEPGREADAGEAPVAGDDLGRVHLVPVVVLGRHPEDGDGLGAAGRQAGGELDGRERLVERVERPREEPDLLARHDGDGLGAAQALDVGERLGGSAPRLVRRGEGVAERAARSHVRVEHAAVAGGEFVVEADGLGVEAAERDGVAEVIEEEARLVRDGVEGEPLDAQPRLLGRAVTG